MNFFILNFESDYTAGAHPKILESFIKTNLEHLASYGADRYSLSAKEKIKKTRSCPDAEIYFLIHFGMSDGKKK